MEAAARSIRYDYFRQTLSDGLLDKIATAHTLDDQAETVLLRLARGTGPTGLAGIYPKWPMAGNRLVLTAGQRPAEPPAIVRPLLSIRHPDLQDYLRDLAQPWREDASNRDARYTRNRIRHKLLPLLESELNPRFPELLAETAEIARAEEDYWAGEVSRIFPRVWTAAAKDGEGTLSITAILPHPLALQRRLLRAVTESLGLSLDFEHVQQMLQLAQAPSGQEKQLILPRGWRVTRCRGSLHFEPPEAEQPVVPHGFAYSLSVPGEVAVAETGTLFRATVGPLPAEGARQAYDPGSLASTLEVRNWRPGDRFWPQHTRAPKKVKELLQERKVPASQRATWPVITSASSGQEQIIWVRGFPPQQDLLTRPGQARGLLIEEFALQDAAHRAE
jgi:tRNA(Ile)-lysidine synthase